MLHAEIWTIAQTKEGSVVLLRPHHTNIAVPIFVGLLEAQSILIGKEGLSLPRPLTHDLILSLLDSLGLIIDRVEIHDLKDNTFHARIIIINDPAQSAALGDTTGAAKVEYTADKPLIIDSRPSDALGLATRRKCTILVSPKIITETGIPVDFFIDSLEDPDISDISPVEAHRHKLMEQLNEAVEKEEYEIAAKIRDILNKL